MNASKAIAAMQGRDFVLPEDIKRLAVCVLALNRGVLPPTINLENQDPECDLDCVPNQSRKAELRYALSNSFGFGGTNGALLLKRFES
jgi:3-oxoacyl-[acyl-carrier-protein] synthase II